MQVLEDFSLFSKFGESMLKSLKELHRSLDREELSHKKQITSEITSVFFKAIDLSSEKKVFSHFYLIPFRREPQILSLNMQRYLPHKQ